PFEVTVDLGGPDERVVDALADAEFVSAGQVIRIRTTGGGGWGDPLERPYAEVARDVAWGKVSVEGARADYGVVVIRDEDTGVVDVDEAAADTLRRTLRETRAAAIAAGAAEPFFDRGPGYARLSGGAPHSPLDIC
ncbi:MAG TPA: hydantoinase B/oxoprolinase family protein, partial [Nocardioidaceae bacterium]